MLGVERHTAYGYCAVALYVNITLLAYTVGVVNTAQRVLANTLHRVTLYCDEVSRCRLKVSDSRRVTNVKHDKLSAAVTNNKVPLRWIQSTPARLAKRKCL